MESLTRRPPGAIDVLDRAAARMRDALAPLVAATAACVVPAGALALSAPLWPAAARLPVVVLPAVIALTLALSVGVILLGDDGLGQRPPAARSLVKAVRSLPVALVLLVSTLFQIAVSALLLVVPGVLRLGRVLPALPVMLLEDVRPVAALRRSAFLTRRVELVGVRALLGAGVAALCVAAAPVSLVFVVLPLPVGGSQSLALARLVIAALVLSCALIPAVAATLFTLFLVRRESLEGLDLQLALQSLDKATPHRQATGQHRGSGPGPLALAPVG